MSTAVSAINLSQAAAMPDKAEPKRASGRQTTGLGFSADYYKLIDSLAHVGGYESVEDFCEQAALKEAHRQRDEYKKLRGNTARRKGQP